jgi:lipopolysaccharide biosynthesis glycosyltransferase
MTKRQKLEMQKFVKKRGQDISFINVSPQKIDKGVNVYENFSFKGRISRIGITRLILSEVLPKTVNKVLYLDSDIIVSDDLAKLYNIDLKNNPIGMVLDIYSTRFYKNPGYYNSGVIIMDLDMWRREKISEKIIEYFHENMDLFVAEKPKYLAADQDLLNILLKNRTTTLPLRWNNLTSLRGFGIENATGIHHYIGPIKPWHFEKKTKSKHFLYYEYWNKSPLKKYKIVCYLKYHTFPKIVSYLLKNPFLNEFFSRRIVTKN